MINLELMTKLYMVVAHNLNEARKARDGNRKGRTAKEPEKPKIGDNILVRDCHGMTESVKVQRKDQSVNKNAYFYYFGQFRVFL